jgi:hypothetical protein
MIEAIRSYSNHTFSNHTLFVAIAEGVPALLSSIHARINYVALNVFIQVIISLPLLYLHHNLFALGFVIGFIFDDQIQRAISENEKIRAVVNNEKIRTIVEKVNIVYKAQNTFLRQFLVFGVGGLLALYTMQTSMPIATLYYSSQWGALLYQDSLAHYRKLLPEQNNDAINLDQQNGENNNII